MIFTKIKRMVKYGFINFWRNGWVSLATVLVMLLTLFIIGSLVILNVLFTSSIARLEEKVDISVYFKTDASEEDIIALKNTIEKLNEVKQVEYISKDGALSRFKERHKDNSLINQSLLELDENPLGASFNIRAKNPGEYESINKFLESGEFEEIIDKINYRQNQIVIERLSKVLESSKKIGFAVTIFMTLIAMLVSFNTIRLAIYTNKEEIGVMRLVGASNNYIRGPFIIEGALYGIFAAMIVVFILYPLTFWLSPKSMAFFGPPNIFSYYLSNFFEIFSLLLLIGIVLGSVSSLIAVRRYLKI